MICCMLSCITAVATAAYKRAWVYLSLHYKVPHSKQKILAAAEGYSPKQGYPGDEQAREAATGGKAASLAPVAAGVASGASEQQARGNLPQVCVRACVCVHARVRVCMCARVRASVCICVCVHACGQVYASVHSTSACLRLLL